MMFHSILAVVPRWCILGHVSYIGMLVFPESWNSSCSSLKGLITSQCSSAPLYESARKAEQAEGQQRQPAYSKARDPGGTISLSTHPTKKDNTVTRMTQNTHTHAHGKWAHAGTLTQTQAQSYYSHTPTCTVDVQKSYIKDIMQHYMLFTLVGRKHITLLSSQKTRPLFFYKMMHSIDINNMFLLPTSTRFSACTLCSCGVFLIFFLRKTNNELIGNHSEKLLIALCLFPFTAWTQEINCCLPLIKYQHKLYSLFQPFFNQLIFLSGILCLHWFDLGYCVYISFPIVIKTKLMCFNLANILKLQL